MTDRERLEEIEEKYSEVTVLEYINDVEIVGVDIKDLVWLINRVEELEKEKDEWKDTAQSYYMTNQELREQNKRYRKAIDNIIEKAMLFGVDEEVYDAIQDAIKELEGEGNAIYKVPR